MTERNNASLKDKLASILAEVETPERRTNILLGLIARSSSRYSLKGVLPSSYAAEAINYLVSREDYKSAGIIAEKSGDIQNAIALFERGNAFQRAAHLYSYEGRIKEAIGAYEKAGDFEMAGRLYERLGDLEGAMGAYVKGEDSWVRIEELCKKVDIDKGIKILIENSRFVEAARLCEEKGDLQEAFRLYKQASVDVNKSSHVLKKAGEIAEKLGLLEEAIEFHRRYGGLGWAAQDGGANRAIRLAKESGRADKAFEIALEKGCLDEAAQIAVQYGFPERAHALVEQHEGKLDFSSLGFLASAAGLVDKATEFHERAGQFGNAEEAAKKGKDKRATSYNRELEDLVLNLIFPDRYPLSHTMEEE